MTEAQTFQTVLIDVMNTHAKDGGHLPSDYGMSKAGTCLGKWLLDDLNHTPFEGWGFTTPGSAFHTFIQDALKIGMVLEIGKAKYQIVSHEQNVYYMRNDKLIRSSPIDTLVYELVSHRFEIWDWKTTQKQAQYIYGMDETNQAQVNIYMHLFSKQLMLGYPMTARVFYVNKANWNEITPTSCVYNQKLAEETLQKFVDFESFRHAKDRWPPYWDTLIGKSPFQLSKTKTPYRVQCKYCDHETECCCLLTQNKGQRIQSIDEYTDEFPQLPFP